MNDLRKSAPPIFVGPGRFELPTSRLSGVRSNQLSYEPEPHARFLSSKSKALWKLNNGKTRSRLHQALTGIVQVASEDAAKDSLERR
jgi:hypothetical protein